MLIIKFNLRLKNHISYKIEIKKLKQNYNKKFEITTFSYNIIRTFFCCEKKIKRLVWLTKRT